MLEELHAASNLLFTALERYNNACTALRHGCLNKSGINGAVEILTSVTNEMGLVELYKSKIAQAQVEIKRARNSLANVPVNSLPAEVLVHIFYLVLARQPCPLRASEQWDSENPVLFPKYPDILSHVCSQWRQIALATYGLWSHIDIALSCSLSKGFHSRAGVYVSRAHQTPLDIHFIDPGCIREVERSMGGSDSGSEQGSSGNEDQYDRWIDWEITVDESNPEEFTFLTFSPEPRIRALGLRVHYQYHPAHNRALEHCFAKILPGSLSELVIDVPNAGGSTPMFFKPGSDLVHWERTKCILSEQQLENAWKSTVCLVVSGRYPSWTSMAYHGLTELRLLGSIDISYAELASVLNSSPGLRILHCDFNIRDSSTSTTLITLRELETLELRGMQRESVGPFLRCLALGPKPLRLSLCEDPTSTLFEDFFTRSNVQELLVEKRIRLLAVGGQPEWSPTKFYLPPQLKILVIVRWGWAPIYTVKNVSIPPRLHERSSFPKELDGLYMISSDFNSLDEFREVVASLSPRRLVLWNCAIRPSALGTLDLGPSFLKSPLGEDLHQLCPSIECLSERDPRPLRDWD